MQHPPLHSKCDDGSRRDRWCGRNPGVFPAYINPPTSGPKRKPPNRLGQLESDDFGVSEMGRAGLEPAIAIYWMIALGLILMVGAPLTWIKVPGSNPGAPIGSIYIRMAPQSPAQSRAVEGDGRRCGVLRGSPRCNPDANRASGQMRGTSDLGLNF